MDCLEIKKIEEFIDKESSKEVTPKYKRIIIVSDSKGSYLRTELGKLDKIKYGNVQIDIWERPGRRTIDGVKYLQQHIQDITDKTIVLFWHFTCDITEKKDRLIKQRFQSTEQLHDTINPSLNKLYEIHSTLEHIDIGILEVPPIFTREWNKRKTTDRGELDDDTPLHVQINELNSLIKSYNEKLGYNSPKFICDFIHRRKKRGSKAKSTLNPVLLKDGVHPINIVAHKWLLKIISSTSN